ncbi:MAG: L,D-transpeptidase [Nitrospiraceae bacterium]|nr:L,D-transpeptidase [Nitrospiraceae bacterium]
MVVSVMIIIMGSQVSAQADSSKKHRGPCEIVYPSDATVEWDCRTLRPGESLEKLFGESWVDVARFNRIDRRHAHSGLSIKVPRSLEDLTSFTPLPLFYTAAERDEQFILIDLTEQFLGAYEYGGLRFASPIASGNGLNGTPTGKFRLAAAHLRHQSDLYKIEETDRPYPMNYALRFHVNREGVSYWIHGRDMPGYPASHGCIGLYDESMQQEQYGLPKDPELNDAKRLFEWVLGGEIDDDRVIPLPHSLRVYIIGQAPSHRLP